MSRIAIVGCGVVGSSWALVFLRAGFEVVLFDAAESARQNAAAFVRSTLPALREQGMGGTDPVDTVLGRLSQASSLEEALDGADYVQESAPERVELKRELYRRLDTLVAPHVPIGSSTSGLPASSFTQGLATARRCLVVHPINPPHLIPLVEIVPSPWTDPAIVDSAVGLMRRLGQSPIRLTREINGFVVNRLQGAMLGEAFRLVEDGICTAAEVDAAVSDGLGLRWFFMGPFETIDLNAQNGVAEYCRNLGPMYHGLAQEQADPRPWGAALVGAVEAQRRLVTPAGGPRGAAILARSLPCRPGGGEAAGARRGGRANAGRTARKGPMMLLGCIADDLTGATDLSLTLTKEGLRTVQSTGIPAAGIDLSGVDALVIALKSRSIPAAEAVALSLEAAHALRALGAQRLLFKYCSTFDSTDEGNIGPVAEALLGLVGGQTIACPAFPRAGRSIYAGHLFVNGVPLSESPMKDHPLNPMHDSNLRRVLARQTRLPVGLVAFEAVEAGPDGIRAALAAEAEAGRPIAIVDALTDRHLRDIGAAVAHLPLVTGGSGIAMGLPAAYLAAGLLTAPDTAAQHDGGPGGAGRRPGRLLLGGDAAAGRERRGGRLAQFPARRHQARGRQPDRGRRAGLGRQPDRRHADPDLFQRRARGHPRRPGASRARGGGLHGRGGAGPTRRGACKAAASPACWSLGARPPAPWCRRSGRRCWRSARRSTPVCLGPGRSTGPTWRWR